jgi:hypothetical protein
MFAGKIDLPRLESLVKTDLPQLQLSDTKEHKVNLGCRAELPQYTM